MKTKAGVVTVILVAGGLMLAGLSVYAKGWMDPEIRAERIMNKIQNELDLNDAQKTSLETLKNELMAIHKETEDQRSAMHERAESLLELATLDQGQALAMVEEHTQAVNQYAPRVVTALATFYDGLSVEQQQTMRDKLKKCHGESHSNSRHGGFFKHHE